MNKYAKTYQIRIDKKFTNMFLAITDVYLIMLEFDYLDYMYVYVYIYIHTYTCAHT
jgi:hypothetical protein